jgi:8-oxo-dGTP pyrophosphatase MutT (NUDIX family)
MRCKKTNINERFGFVVAPFEVLKNSTFYVDREHAGKQDIPEGFGVDRATIPSLEQPDCPQSFKKISAGIVVVEPNEKIWFVRPRNEFGGYVAAFPKGRVEPGEDVVGAAMRETYEESGIAAIPVAFIGDFEGITTITRFFIGVRIGGNPLFPPTPLESSQVVLADAELVKEALVMSDGTPNERDIAVLRRVQEWIGRNGIPNLESVGRLKYKE